MPQFDSATFSAQIFWLILCFVGLSVFTVRYSIPKLRSLLKERWAKTDGYKVEAKKLLDQVTEIHIGRDLHLNQARETAYGIVNQAQKAASKELSAKKDDFSASIKNKLDHAEKSLLKQKDGLLQDISSHVHEFTDAILAKVIDAEVTMTKANFNEPDKFKKSL